MLCDGLSKIVVKIFFCQERDLNAFRGRITNFLQKQKTKNNDIKKNLIERKKKFLLSL